MVSQHALQVVSQHALQVSRRGGVSQHALQVSRPTPKGELVGSGWGGLQAHTHGGVSRPIPGGQGWCIPTCTEADPPCGWYASYLNSFLL